MPKLYRDIVVSGLIFSFLAINACVIEATPPPPTPKIAVSTPIKASWQEEWEDAVGKAKREGKVDIVLRWESTVRDVLSRAFKEKYGIEIEYTPGEMAAIWPKVDAERRSGLYLRDVALQGSTSLATTMVDGGAAEPFEKILILPEVKDNNAWRDKRLPFFDKEGKIFLYLTRVGSTMIINREMANPEEIKSWRNLLEPKWKGKILLYDPSVTGNGNAVITTVGEIMGIDYLKELARQEPLIHRDKRLQVEWVARGKYPVGLGVDISIMEEMRGAGAPIAHVVPSEGTYFGSGPGSLAMFNKPAHSNSAKLFINWFLSKEGQTLMCQAAKEQSRRVDVTTDLPPDRLFQEGTNYVDFDTEYMFNKRTEMLKLSKEIFAAQYK